MSKRTDVDEGSFLLLVAAEAFHEGPTFAFFKHFPAGSHVFICKASQSSANDRKVAQITTISQPAQNVRYRHKRSRVIIKNHAGYEFHATTAKPPFWTVSLIIGASEGFRYVS